MDKQFFNIILLGISFLLIFTAFNTGSIIQKNVVAGINLEYKKAWDGREWNAYNSLSLLYVVFSFANWIAPPIIEAIGPKGSMILGALTYVLFIANFLYPIYYGLTIVSVLIGIGAAIIWIAQGKFLTINSDENTITRNSGVFWALFQGSLLFGNIFVYFEFQGQEVISEDVRMLTYSVLTATCAIGVCLLFFLRNVKVEEEVVQVEEREKQSPIQQIYSACRLCKTNIMLNLCLTYFYTGIVLSFYSGIYSAAIASTKKLGTDRKKFAGISGMLIGVGEILGGAVFGIFGKKTTKKGKEPVILFGFVLHMVSYFIIYFNLPPTASLIETDDNALITTNLPLALLCSVLIGLGDACYNTQVYSVIGSLYKNDSASAFAIFKFVQSIAAGLSFYYSNYTGLDIHVYILALTAAIGTISFFFVLKADSTKKTSSEQTLDIENSSS